MASICVAENGRSIGKILGCRLVVFTRTHVIQSGFELMYLRMILLPLSPWCWDYRYVLPGLCCTGALNQGFTHNRQALQLSLIPGPSSDFCLTCSCTIIHRACLLLLARSPVPPGKPCSLVYCCLLLLAIPGFWEAEVGRLQV